MACDYCGKKDSVQVILTCGYTVCLDHVTDQKDNFLCIVCKNHSINKNQLFKMNKNRSILAKLEYNNYLKSIREKFFSIKSIKQSPEFHINIYLMNLRDSIEYQKESLKLSIMKKIDSYGDTLLDELEKFRPKYLKTITEDLNYIHLDQIDSDIKEINEQQADNDPDFYPKQLNKLKNMTYKLEYMNSLYQNSITFESKCTDTDIDFEKCFGRLKIGLQTKPVAPYLAKLNERSQFEANATCLSILQSGEIACGTKGGLIKIWDPVIGKCIQKIKAHKTTVNCIRLGDNQCLYTCSSDNTIKIWNKVKGKCIKTIRSPNCSLEVIELWNDQIISCDWSEVIRIWDSQRGECTQMLNDHQSLVFCLALIGSNRLLSGSNDKNIILWDLENFNRLKIFSEHQTTVMCLDILDQNSFLSGSKDGEIKIWNIDTNECLMTIKAHDKAVREFQVCENKEFLSCSEDGTIKLWTELSNTPVSELKVNNSELICLKFMPNDGLITCEKSGIIRIFSE